jgi:hypothetical protein
MRLIPSALEIRWFCATLFLFIIIVCLGFNDKKHPAQYEISFKTLTRQPDDITCGPASTVMVLNHYGKDISIDEVKKITKTVWYSRNGVDFGMTAPQLIREALDYFGFFSKLNYGGLDTLKHFVSLGKPCIVLIRSDEYTWHYIVVTGFSDGKINFANPTQGQMESVSEETFVRAWRWTGDLSGRDCGWWIAFWLRTMEIYPNSFVHLE